MSHDRVHASGFSAFDALGDAENVSLTMTVRHTGEALGRIASTLRNVSVRELAYAVTGTGRATAELVVTREDADRACRRLRRMVDVLTVTERLPGADTAPGHGCSAP